MAGSPAEETAGRIALIRYTIFAVDDGSLELVETTEEEVAKKFNAKDKLVKGPRPVLVGKSKLIDAVEEALLKMREGDEVEFEAPPEKAYGPRDPSNIIRVPIKHLRRSGIPPRVGSEVSVSGRRGRIVRVTERFAYIDFNHPLAGKKLKIWLKFERELKTPEEKASALAERWLGVSGISAEYSDGTLTLQAPTQILAVKDLDSRMALLLRDLMDAIPGLKKLIMQVSIEIPETPEETSGEKEGKGSKLDEGEAQQETVQAAEEGGSGES